MLVPGVPNQNLAVRYRGAPEPQLLDVSFVTSVDVLPETVRAWELAMCDGVLAGAAGSDVFDPRIGSAAVLNEGLEGRRGHVRLEVTGVAPRFLRVMIESLAHRVGPLESLMLQGALAPSADAPSVQTEEIARWLAAGREYPLRWGAVPFSVSEGDTGGAALRVKFEGPIPDGSRAALMGLIFTWRGLVVAFADTSGSYPGDMARRFPVQWPRFGFSSTELRVRFPEFVHAAAPSAALLVNMLCRFHATTPIESCEIKI